MSFSVFLSAELNLALACWTVGKFIMHPLADEYDESKDRALGPRSLRVILPELHSSNGRIDAKNLASFLGIRLAKLCSGLELTYGTVHKNPDSEAIQPALRPVKRILEILYDYFRAPEVIRAWLNSVHPDLGMSPLDAILANKEILSKVVYGK